jgi:hypothetical protein
MSTRDDDERVICAAINGGIFEVNRARIQNAESLVRAGTDAEVRAIADALRLDPEGFNGTFLQSMYIEDNLDFAATLATVYSPDIDPGRSRHFRMQAMKGAYIYYVAADESAYPHLRRNKDLADHPIWSITNESQTLRKRARRFVAMTCAVNGLTPRASLEVEEALRAIMLDDTRDDHYTIIEFLRQNNRRNVTLEQLEFVISGGPTAMSVGAL